MKNIKKFNEVPKIGDYVKDKYSSHIWEITNIKTEKVIKEPSMREVNVTYFHFVTLDKNLDMWVERKDLKQVTIFTDEEKQIIIKNKILKIKK